MDRLSEILRRAFVSPGRLFALVAAAAVLVVPVGYVHGIDISMLRFSHAIDSYYKDGFRNPKGIFVDNESGEIYVTDNIRNEIMIFDLEGTPVHRFTRVQGVTAPIEIALSGDRIYVTSEGRPYIEVLNFLGEQVDRIAPRWTAFYPGRFVIDDDGTIYAVNTASGECMVFDSEGEYTGTIGKGFSSLAAVAVGSDKVYLLTPTEFHVIQVYSKDGSFITAFEGIDSRGGTLGLPTNAKVDDEGRLWVVDSLRGIIVFSPDYVEIHRFGLFGPSEERLTFPLDIDFDMEDRVYILDKGAKRVSVFR